MSSLVNTCQPERFRDEYRTHYKALYKCPVCLLTHGTIEGTTSTGTVHAYPGAVLEFAFWGASGVAIISARGAWTNIATLNHPELNSYQQT